MLRPVIEVCGWIGSFHADAMRGDAQRLGDAAGLREIRLQDGDRAVLDHAVELEARVMVLARGERHAAEASRQR